MTKQHISERIKKIEEALKFSNTEIKKLLNDDEFDELRVNVLEKDYYVLEIEKMDLMLLLVTNDTINDIINIIRSSPSAEEASNNLIKILSWTKPQADSILELDLSELTGGVDEEKYNEYKKELKTIEDWLINSSLYNALSEKEVEFIKKSLDISNSIS